MNKDYDVIFYTKSDSAFKLLFKDITLEKLKDSIEKTLPVGFLGDGERYINLAEVVYFEINEKIEVLEKKEESEENV